MNKNRPSDASQKPLDKLGVSAVFLTIEPYLKRFLRRFLSHSQDIEDVVQNTYIKARCAEEDRVIDSPKSFLFRIARNEALMELRKKSRRITDYIEELDVPETPHEGTSLEDELMTEQKLGIFCQSVLEMPPRCREVFLMCKVYGQSYKEVATQLGMSVSGVEKHVARGFKISNAYADRIERKQYWGAESERPPMVVPLPERVSKKDGVS